MSINNDPLSNEGYRLTRRRFVQGLAMGSAFASLGMGPSALAGFTKQQGPQTLRGAEFKLAIGEQAGNFTGAAVVVP